MFQKKKDSQANRPDLIDRQPCSSRIVFLYPFDHKIHAFAHTLLHTRQEKTSQARTEKHKHIYNKIRRTKTKKKKQQK